LKAVALKNMAAILVTAPVFQPPMGWLKAVRANMASMLVTAPVFQPPMDGLPPLLKTVAKLNMAVMLVTELVIHEPMFWLNEEANWNM